MLTSINQFKWKLTLTLRSFNQLSTISFSFFGNLEEEEEEEEEIFKWIWLLFNWERERRERNI